MRPSLRHLVLLILVALVAALIAVLLLQRPPVAAPTQPTESLEGGTEEPAFGAGPPAVQEWTSIAWDALGDPLAGALPPRPRLDMPQMRIDGITDAGALLVGWGRVPTPGRNQFNDMGAVFISEDGRTWNVIPIDHGVSMASTSEIRGVASGPLGHLAHGSVCCEPGGPAIWLSDDGETWTRQEIAGDAADDGGFFAGIIALDDSWVAIGGGGPDGLSGRIWISSDGVSWETVLTVEGGAMLGAVVDIVATPDGLVAVGTVTGPDGTHDGAVWMSSDGRAWERTAEDDPALVGEGESMIVQVVSFADGLAIFGGHGSSEDRRQCEGISMAGDRPPPPRGAAISCGWTLGHTWVSDDGEAWQRIDPATLPGIRPIEFRHVVAGGPGLVLLGETSAPESPDTTLFTSEDGLTWTPVGPEQPMSEGVVYGLVVRGNAILAVTDHFDGTSSQIRFWVGAAR